MALLRQHSCKLTPFRTPAVAGLAVVTIRCGSSDRPVLSTELQPPRSLSASHSCLNMSQDGGQCRIDVSILEALWLTTTTGQFSLCLNRLPSIRFGCLVSLGGCVLCFFRPPSRRCFGREFKTSSSHWWKWLSRWSEIDPLCSIQHRSDTATGQAGATPRGCAEIKTKQRGFGGKLSVCYLYCVFFNFYWSE